jgi:peptidyl-prolyl cis-trans isomerase B (cyclophilin B)
MFKVTKLSYLGLIFLLIATISSFGAARANNSTPGSQVICENSSAVPHDPPKVTAPALVSNPLPKTFTLVTNCGDITIRTFENLVPITLTALSALATVNYWDKSNCHRLTTSGLFVLQCGDPTETGSGAPGFTFSDENFPKATLDNYPRGYVAMANSGPNTNGAQFFITHKSSTIGPHYSIWGKVIQGMDIVDLIATSGVAGGGQDGRLALKLEIKDVIVDKFASLTTNQLQDFYLESISNSSKESNALDDLYSQLSGLQVKANLDSKQILLLSDQVTSLKKTVSDLNKLIQESDLEIETLKSRKSIVCKKGSRYFSSVGNPAFCPAGSRQVR